MRILLVIHGLPHDELILRLGAQVARNAGQPPTVVALAGSTRDRPRAEASLARARATLAEIPELDTRLRLGAGVQAVLDETRRGGFELLVVGDREHHALAYLFGAFNPIQLAEQAPCPVLIVKGQAGPIQKILLCDSGASGPLADHVVRARQGEPSLLARFTAQIASVLHGQEEITVLHVMSQIGAGPGIEGRQLQADAEELMRQHTPEGELLWQDIQVLVQPGVQVRPKVRHGLVLDEITHEAQAGNYDLVVIGAHRGERWQRLLLDDLAHKIILSMDRPVLVVR